MRRIWNRVKSDKNRNILKMAAAVAAILGGVGVLVPYHHPLPDNTFVADGIAVEDISGNNTTVANSSSRDARGVAEKEREAAYDALVQAKKVAEKAEADLRWVDEEEAEEQVRAPEATEGRSVSHIKKAEAQARLFEAHARLFEAKAHLVQVLREKWEGRHNVRQWRENVRQPITTVDQALSLMKPANIAFNAPDRARVGVPFVIELKLSRHLEKQELKNLIKEAGAVEEDTLQVSDNVVATLGGSSSFDVSPIGPREQLLFDPGPVIWTWTVTPKAVGAKQVLTLALDNVISVNGKDSKLTIRTFTKYIDVNVHWPETTNEWLETIKNTGENVSWIWATLLLPITGGAWAWLKARKWASKATKPGATLAPAGRDPPTS
jgi:hypothetical protein